MQKVCSFRRSFDSGIISLLFVVLRSPRWGPWQRHRRPPCQPWAPFTARCQQRPCGVPPASPSSTAISASHLHTAQRVICFHIKVFGAYVAGKRLPVTFMYIVDSVVYILVLFVCVKNVFFFLWFNYSIVAFLIIFSTDIPFFTNACLPYFIRAFFLIF